MKGQVEEGGSESKIKNLISQLEEYAGQEGCSVEELVEKYSGGDNDDEEAEGEGNSGKVALIVARMKKKQPAGDDYEG